MNGGDCTCSLQPIIPAARIDIAVLTPHEVCQIMRGSAFRTEAIFTSRNLRKPIGTCDSQLPITNYPLPITHYPLPITHYQ